MQLSKIIKPVVFVQKKSFTQKFVINKKIYPSDFNISILICANLF